MSLNAVSSLTGADQSGQNHVFASVLETHGYFNESIEASVGARGLVKSVTVVGHNSTGTVIRIETTTSETYHYGISNLPESAQSERHDVEFNGKRYTWDGSIAQI